MADCPSPKATESSLHKWDAGAQKDEICEQASHTMRGRATNLLLWMSRLWPGVVDDLSIME